MDAHRGAPPAGQQIVHVRGDSQTELEALFTAVMNPNAAKQPSSLPMRMRKLPDSFFRQPDPRGHSRQASSDGGVCGSQAPHHVRAHSSPASLPVNSLSTQAADVAATPIIPDDMPLPRGWEMAKTPTGQRYFLNHLDKTTTWHDPRLAQLQSAAAQHPISGPPVHAHSLSNPAPTTQPQNINPEKGPLPEGWEQAVTADGEMYYIDHINKNTTWVDPRLAQKMNPSILGMAMQQSQEKDRLRCKQGIPQQIAPQDVGGRSQMPGGMDHDRSAQTLVPSLDVRIRASNHEPTLNGAHSRNESTDSGLSVSSLPRTTDHMLSSVEHMDTGDSEPPSMALQDSMPVLPMSEGEELMPCIPEGLSSDLLMDMETVLSGSHMDRDSLLTWL
ncbi:transcriptional coactivator YAP1 isoform X1 [Maylandia zebra]|uniref:Transcriptional coactivator YAP1-like n=4 Tax=Haplochromini TaxID=319058 RepID=A0A3B4GXZ2_9CICH|nr:transcriptional coactivator YAP1 isoform X1 [Maylandia zebra]XP_005751097.1 PREDICTED: transcriptional coactivator YAP1-like isoform X1 [Pundamilia nyererei]XP_005945420.1 transcriptional coactivator YAP1 isoform X1 [Haplochromis burtoni]XP_026037126.1 transcriptional coactivator YAP1-like isoform X1 [Astatotilapia calliptera]XP_026037127.1 transcriptional coactivator YAP1-like isoform X1 [Astatotilapia calliptera]XP_035767585.1 transcriptional coactivator YAP1-like isoform X1 [Neolamprolog